MGKVIFNWEQMTLKMLRLMTFTNPARTKRQTFKVEAKNHGIK